MQWRRIHGKALHGVAAITQRPEDEVLDRVLIAAQRPETHEFLRVGDLRGKALVDRSDDAGAVGPDLRSKHS